MPHLSPPTLTESEQQAILAATVGNIRDNVIYSLALGTGLRLAEVVGLNVGDVYFPDGTPRTRVRIRAEKGGREQVRCAVASLVTGSWSESAKRRASTRRPGGSESLREIAGR